MDWKGMAQEAVTIHEEQKIELKKAISIVAKGAVNLSAPYARALRTEEPIS